MNQEVQPAFFTTQLDFRKWLIKNHQKAPQLIVGFYKIGSGKKSMSWPESVDQALCFGWIDSVRKTIDHESYQIRFTPRKPTSIWSAVNIRKVNELIDKGLMQPAGLAIFEFRKEHKSKIYAHENEETKFSAEFEKKFRANKKAWTYFTTLALSYRKPSANWVMHAKQKETREKRLQDLIADSEKGFNKWKDNPYKGKKEK